MTHSTAGPGGCNPRAWSLLVLLVCLGIPAGAAEPSSRAIRRSDVVFMYDNPEMYKPYGCTVMGWAGSADPKRIEQAHGAGVRHFSCSVGFLTEFRGAIDFDENFLDEACRNFAGEPFIVPWLWDHVHKDKPAYWWCTNSPLYRRYLYSRLEKVMAAKPDGLHIDDYRGTSGSVTWRSGGFCRHCMAAFNKYLGENVPKGKLAELGITDLAAFDYRQFLLDRGVKPEEYNGRRAGLPLAAEFYDFQVTADNAFVVEYRRRAEALRGGPVTLCVNSGLSNPHALAVAPHLSYFCCEVGHNAASRAPAAHPIYIYKLGDGLNRPITSTASGHDWAYVMEHDLTCLVRTWTALSYAFGQTLMAPHRQWCYTKEKGTHWYTGPSDQYAYVYRFVRENARLLDGYEAVAPVAVVYDNAARRRGRGNIEPICIELAQRNVPFTVVMAGDDWLDYRLDAQRLAPFKAVVLACPFEGDDAQKALVEEVKKQGRLVLWPDNEKLQSRVPPPVVVEGSSHIMAVPRAVPGDAKAPAVVHLLNRQYDGEQDAMTAQRNVVLRLRSDLFAGRKFTKAMLHAPRKEPQSLALRTDGEYTRIEVPELELWGIVELGE